MTEKKGYYELNLLSPFVAIINFFSINWRKFIFTYSKICAIAPKRQLLVFQFYAQQRIEAATLLFQYS